MKRESDFPVDLVVGFSGAERNACVAVCAPDRVLGICEQERVTRVRAAGVNRTGLPDEALDELLRRAGRSRRHVATYVTSEKSEGSAFPCAALDHHFAHACAAFLPTSFESAAILICDHRAPQVSVWDGIGSSIGRVEWPWVGPGYAEFYSQCATAMGFEAPGKEQRFEALARLNPLSRSADATNLVAGEPDRLRLAPDWQSRVEASVRATGSRQETAGVAAALQTRIGDLLVELVREIRRRLPGRTRLCVGGSLFYNSYFNSRVRQCGEFDEVFVPINPGNAGLSVGAALHACQDRRHTVSPFLGPWYSAEETKATLDAYGVGKQPTDEFGRNCLVARRLVERGVRFVQLYSGGGHLEETWDAHQSIEKNHGQHAAEVDKPIAALLADLEKQGLLESTLVVWGGEFGRMPFSERQNAPGRNHNPYGISM